MRFYAAWAFAVIAPCRDERMSYDEIFRTMVLGGSRRDKDVGSVFSAHPPKMALDCVIGRKKTGKKPSLLTRLSLRPVWQLLCFSLLVHTVL